MWPFSKEIIEFYDKDNNKIDYKEYLEKEDMLIVDRGNGLEKIPASGLTKVIK